MFYFAYGTNLNSNIQKKLKVHLKKIKIYKLKNYKLVFRKPYGDPDIEPAVNSTTPGVIFDLNVLDEKKLDHYEDYPNYYKKTFIDPTKIMFYEMINKTKCQKPSFQTQELLKAGYLEHGLDLRILNHFIQNSF